MAKLKKNTVVSKGSKQTTFTEDDLEQFNKLIDFFLVKNKFSLHHVFSNPSNFPKYYNCVLGADASFPLEEYHNLIVNYFTSYENKAYFLTHPNLRLRKVAETYYQAVK